MANTRIKDLSKTATTVASDANIVIDGSTNGTQKIARDNFRQDTADAYVAAPTTYNLAPLNSGTNKIDATYLPASNSTPKGGWDANANTPTLIDGTGTAGDYYDVTTAGSVDLGSGSITYTVGDVVKYNGTIWFKIDSVANILDGSSTISQAKVALEIPDTGTGANETPLNLHLGSGAYLDFDAHYETGTWTPTLTFGGGSTGLTYTSQEGFYTRIGNTVFCTGGFILSAVGSDTGVAAIALPFTARDTTDDIQGVSVGRGLAMAALTSAVSGYIINNTTTCRLVDWGATGVVDLVDTNFTGTTEINISATYQI